MESIGSRIVYELDHRKPVFYVIPIQTILGTLPVVSLGDTGAIPYYLRNAFLGQGDGCRMWFVNSWVLR